ncbi:MAG TPA: succinate dehydrogenase, hydrophobic membrane anchor protein [Devosiaceae bacterium]
MSMRTPLSRVTGLGSAREGTTHFWRQRLTALANVPLTIFLVWLVLQVGGADRATLVATFANPLVAGLTVLLIVSASWHMKLGMQVIVEDYVHSEALKILALAGNTLIAFAVAGLAIVSVLKLAFGG